MTLRVEVQIFDSSGETEEEVAEISIFDGMENYDVIDIIKPRLTPRMMEEINAIHYAIFKTLKRY